LIRKIVAVAALLATSVAVDARQGAQPLSQIDHLAPAPLVSLAMRPTAALLAEDATAPRGTPLRFAQPLSVNLTPANSGRWQKLADGSWLWAIEFDVPGATDLNLALAQFRLPPRAQLHVIGADGYYQGPYTAADNRKHGQLWLPLVPGARARLELHVADRRAPLTLAITRVNAGYRDVFHGGLARSAASPKSGSCNIDVACPVAEPWRSEARSVAMYTFSGMYSCTATLVRDAASSLKPLMLSAAHCDLSAGEAATVTVYWNYEAAQCGGARNGSLSQNQNGAVLRARRTDVDASLFELDTAPDPEFHAYYAGWDRSGTPPAGSVGIHHPSGDEKAISFNDDPLTTVNSCIGSGVGTHWLVDNYEQGTTEEGSSGSALFDPANHRVVGFLSGGTASCADTAGYDCFGKVAVAWDGASAATRLRDWLDPNGSGASFIDGMDTPGSLKLVGTRFADQCPAVPANGVAQPGEALDLFVKLEATAAASAIRGTLGTSSPGVSIVTGNASWPNLAGGGAAENLLPLRIQLASGASCPAPIALTLSTTGTGLAAQQIPLTVALGGGGAIGTAGVAIPDGAGSATSRARVDRAGPLSNLAVRVKIAHSWVGDLKLVLRHPSGAEVVLLDRPGVPADSYGCDNDDLDVRFTDTASQVLESFCPGTRPWFAGDALPVSPLASLASLPVKGQWQLIVTDAQGGDAGIIESFAIEADELQHCAVCVGESTVFVTPAGDVNGDGKPDLAMLVQRIAYVRNGDSGALIRKVPFDMTTRQVAMIAVPSVGGTAAPDLVAFGRNQNGSVLETHDAASGEFLGRLPQVDVDAVDLASYVGGDAVTRYALIATRQSDGRGLLRSIVSASGARTTAVLEARFQPRALAVLPRTGAGAPERIAVLGERDDRPRVLIYDGDATAPSASFFAQPAGYQAVDIATAGDGHGLAILALDPSGSRGQLQVRSITGAPTISRTLAAGRRPFAVFDIGDTENDLSRDLAVLGLDVDGHALAQVLDSTAGTVMKNWLFAGAGQARAATLTPSLPGAGMPQIAIVRRTAASAALRLEARDATQGGLAAFYAVGQ
jgi:lysyl endopeptidase